ncbi:response regulator [Magnetococcales bacterium HHB-1]
MATDLSHLISPEALEQAHMDIRENLDNLEQVLLLIEGDQCSQEPISAIFRHIHTVKGVAHMYGFSAMVDLAHAMEDAYNLVQTSQLKLSEEMITLTLQGKDVLSALLDEDEDESIKKAQEIKATFRAWAPLDQAHSWPKEKKSKKSKKSKKYAKNRFKISFGFNKEETIFNSAIDPGAYIQALESFGKCQIAYNDQALPSLETFNPEICYLDWEILLATKKDQEEIQEEFLFIEDELSHLNIESLDRKKKASKKAPKKATKKRKEQPEIQEILTTTFNNLRILVADDELNNRLLLKKYLEDLGDIDLVVDGLEAVEVFQLELEEGIPYDLILLDIMMPEMNGQEALKEIRRIEKEHPSQTLRETAIIMVTALDSAKDVIEAYYRGGCTDYLTKPITRSALFEKLRNNGLIS